MKVKGAHSLGLEYPLEKEMVTHFSIFAWKIPRREKLGGLHIVHGVARIRHDLANKDHHYYPGLQISGFSLHSCDAVPSRLVISNSLQPHGLYPSRLLCLWRFSRQEYCSGLPCPPPGDLPNPGIKPRSPTLQMDSLPSEPLGKPLSFM